MIFKFVVGHLGFLKHIPLSAWLFDALLMIWNLVSNRRLARWIESIEASIAAREGISVSIHKFGGLQFNYFQREIGHIHSNGILDIRLNNQQKKALIEKGLVEEHHVLKKSGWVSFYIRSDADVEKALALLNLSCQNVVMNEIGAAGMRMPSLRQKRGSAEEITANKHERY